MQPTSQDASYSDTRNKLKHLPPMNLKFQQAKQSKPVAVTSLAFPTGDVNNFVVGSEDGAVYTACRYFISITPILSH